MKETHEKHFREWFADILEPLKNNDNAGFPIVMVSFPLLERYIREKSGDHENKLSPKSNAQLRKIFPELVSPKQAEEFWNVWRNGLLHQAFPRRIGTGKNQRAGGLHKGSMAISIDRDRNFWIDPNKFCDRVLNTIQSDFETFLGKGSPNQNMAIITDTGGTSAY